MDLPITNYHTHSHNPMMDKMIAIPQLKNVFAFLKYEKAGIAQKLVYELKYQGNQSLGQSLGHWFADHMHEHFPDKDIDLIIPIPLHKNRHRKRGFNQAAVIATGFAKKYHIVVREDIMSRTKSNNTQTKKGRMSRWQNVDALFQVNKPEDITDKSIMLFDDVVTTGATIIEAAEALSQYQPRAIYIACIATGK